MSRTMDEGFEETAGVFLSTQYLFKYSSFSAGWLPCCLISTPKSPFQFSCQSATGERLLLPASSPCCSGAPAIAASMYMFMVMFFQTVSLILPMQTSFLLSQIALMFPATKSCITTPTHVWLQFWLSVWLSGSASAWWDAESNILQSFLKIHCI